MVMIFRVLRHDAASGIADTGSTNMLNTKEAQKVLETISTL